MSEENLENEVIDLETVDLSQDGSDKARGRNPFENKNEKKGGNVMLTISTFIVDKRNLFFLLYIILAVFSAFSRNWVKVENSLSAYLPEDSETSIGLNLMEEEFTTYGSANIMVTNIDENEAGKIADLLEAQDEVYMLTYEPKSDYKNFSALYSVTYMFPEENEKAKAALEKSKDMLAGYDVYVESSMIDNSAANIDAEMQKIIVLVAIIVVGVLILTSQTYAEVPVLILTFLSSAIVAMGTNFLLGTISFVSDSVTIVLQLALSVDYAIIFCNRYKEEHQTRNIREAVIIALSKSIPEITASSLTTIGGLVAMMFMQFTLGRDLAICLIKAILLSLCSVFLLMPGLLMLFGRAMDKSRHQSFIPRISWVGKFGYYTRFFIPPLFVAAIVFAFMIQRDTPYVYGYTLIETPVKNDDQKINEMITETFGDNNMVALCIPKDDFSKQKELVELLSGMDEVESIVSMTNTEARGGYMLADRLTPRQFCEAMETDYNVAELLYTAHAAKEEDYGRIIAGIDTYQVEFFEMINFLYDEVNDGYVTLDDETMATLTDAHTKIGIAENQLMGENYDRMLMYLTLPEEGDETFAFLDEIHEICKEFYEDEVYVVGESTSQRDLCRTFSKDNTVVSFVSIIAVLAVLLFTFKSAGMPVLLIIVIQGAIWTNFSFPAIQQSYLFFLSYLIVSSIQMGANIDYAIVISSRFMDVKDEMPKKEAIVETMNFAFPTIITSGTMLAMAGILIGSMTSDGAIVGIGQCLGRGTIISIVIVMFILPQILLLGEKIIDRTKFTVSVPVVLKHSEDVVRVDGWFKGRMFSVILSLLIAGSLIAGSVIPVEAARVSASSDAGSEDALNEAGEEKEIIYIHNESEFVELCRNCSVDSYSSGIVAELMEDIDLSKVKKVKINAPLGYICIPYWNGEFHGNDHTVNCADYTASGYADGLFRFVGEDGIVEDIVVKAAVSMPEGGGSITGGIAGINKGQIISSIFSGVINGSSKAGGIAGLNDEAGIISGTTSHGVISGFSAVGGTAGENHGVIEGCLNCAVVNNSTEWLKEEDSSDIMDLISDLTATGTADEVRASGSSDAGGICGYSDGLVIKSNNRGIVGYPYTGYNIGGVCGRSSGRIYECSNSALVQGRKDVGGICGQMEPDIVVDNSETMDTAVEGLDSSVQGTRRTVDTYLDSWSYTEPEGDELVGTVEHNDTEEFADDLKGDLDLVQRQAKRTISVFSSTVDSVRSFDISNYYEDISDTVSDTDTAGKAYGCKNTGAIIATRNAGGIVGSMGMESQDTDEAEAVADQQIEAGSVFKTKCILTDSESNCVVSIRENNGGAVCGYAGLGVIEGCKGCGRVKSEEGSYIGGICGQSTGVIRSSASAANLTGAEFVGGIAGLGRKVYNCASVPVVTGEAERIGGVLGQALSEDGEYGVLEENLSGNVFVSGLLEGIDSVSYASMARKVPSVAQLKVPEIDTDTDELKSAIIYDEEEEADTVIKTIASDGEVIDREGVHHPIALASGEFDDTIKLIAAETAVDVSPVMDEGNAECYIITMEGAPLAASPLRVWCYGDENAEIYTLTDGYFIPVDLKVRGGYAHMEPSGDEITVCVLHPDYSKRDMTYIVMGVIAFGIIVIVIVVLVRIFRRSRQGIEKIKEIKAEKKHDK